MESVYHASYLAPASAQLLFVLAGLVAFLFALFFGKVSINAIRDGRLGKWFWPWP